MRFHTRLSALLALALPLGACDAPSATATPTSPAVATIANRAPAAAKSQTSPQERAVRAAMDALKQAVIDSDVDELARTWTEDYTFINPQGAIVTRAQRLANLASGNTDVAVIDSEREITVRVDGNTAVVQNLSTLHGRFNGVPTDTDLRGTFVWVRRNGRWQLVTNQLTAVTPPSTLPSRGGLTRLHQDRRRDPIHLGHHLLRRELPNREQRRRMLRWRHRREAMVSSGAAPRWERRRRHR